MPGRRRGRRRRCPAAPLEGEAGRGVNQGTAEEGEAEWRHGGRRMVLLGAERADKLPGKLQ